LILPIVGALTYYVVAYPLAYWILYKILRLPMFDAVPLIYGTATKNLSIAMGMAAAAFGPMALLGVVTCLILQMPLASLWHKIFSKMEITVIEAPLTKGEVKKETKEKESVLD
jgi:ACR3 family arsenite efflux pump ArsB